jgi:hypothetical protein
MAVVPPSFFFLSPCRIFPKAWVTFFLHHALRNEGNRRRQGKNTKYAMPRSRSRSRKANSRPASPRSRSRPRVAAAAAEAANVTSGNPWVEFLREHGGQGLSRHELRQLYKLQQTVTVSGDHDPDAVQDDSDVSNDEWIDAWWTQTDFSPYQRESLFQFQSSKWNKVFTDGRMDNWVAGVFWQVREKLVPTPAGFSQADETAYLERMHAVFLEEARVRTRSLALLVLLCSDRTTDPAAIAEADAALTKRWGVTKEKFRQLGMELGAQVKEAFRAVGFKRNRGWKRYRSNEDVSGPFFDRGTAFEDEFLTPVAQDCQARVESVISQSEELNNIPVGLQDVLFTHQSRPAVGGAARISYSAPRCMH